MMVVAIDDRQAASEMTRHLIDLGYRRFAFILGNPQHRSSARRLEGFRAAMTAQGLAVEEYYFVESSAEARAGQECVSTCRYRWSPYHQQKIKSYEYVYYTT